MKSCLLIVCAFALASAPALAQTASLRGQITDESGAIIPGAQVTVAGTAGAVKSAAAAADGFYSIAGLQPGDYTIAASAPDLVLPAPVRITLRAGVQSLNLQLKVASTVQQVIVNDRTSPAVTTDPSGNASAVVLTGESLQSLADDPEDLAADLQALAGPSAGPNGGTIFIDGFSGGELPPKESIREIRVNQNPFSPEYDTLGLGRIEIFTKPGKDKLRGGVFYNFGDDFWNSRNPYAAQKAPFLLKEYGGNLGGPINGRTSFTLDIQRHAIDNGSIINGSTLDPQTLAVVTPYTQVYRVPQRRVIVTPRVDYQLSSKHTLTARYSFTDTDVTHAGVGTFNLVSLGYDGHTITHTLQITETAAVTPSLVNETRFQFFRVDTSLIANNPGPTLQVLGAFTGGGSALGRAFDAQNSYEVQNYTSLLRGTHVWKFGVRLRNTSEDSVSPQNFGGTFVFSGGLAPELNANNQPVLDASGQPILTNIASIESYRRTLLHLPGGGAAQYTLTGGNPSISASQFDAGIFAGDDWRVRRNITLSMGLRYEVQTNIHDWREFGPRLGLAWSPGRASGTSAPKNVIRAGFGMFYNRVPLVNTIVARRYNGIMEQQCVVANPDFFPSALPLALLPAANTRCTIQELDARVRAAYAMQSALGFERQLPRNTTISVTYSNAHWLHLLRSEDINAPAYGTYDPQVPGSGLFPRGNSGPVFLVGSSAIYNQNQVITNVNSRMTRNVSLFGSYVYNRASSDIDGTGTFPASPYSLEGEYGPASTDIRHSVSLGGAITTKWGLIFNPLLTATSGPPFNITVGHDLYGDTLFNGRPGLATDPSKPGVIMTSYGLLDPNPTPDEKILPRNFGRGPGAVMLNVTVRKVFGLGPAAEGVASAIGNPTGGGAGAPSGPFGTGNAGSAGPAVHRYNLAISMAMRNVLNHNNPGPIIGNIASPLFGQANQPFNSGVPGGTGFSESANNRRLEFQARLTF